MAPWCSGQRPGRNDIPVLREKGSAMVHVDGKDFDGKDSKKKERESFSALIVAPASLIYNLQAEVKKFAPSLMRTIECFLKAAILRSG